MRSTRCGWVRPDPKEAVISPSTRTCPRRTAQQQRLVGPQTAPAAGAAARGAPSRYRGSVRSPLHAPPVGAAPAPLSHPRSPLTCPPLRAACAACPGPAAGTSPALSLSLSLSLSAAEEERPGPTRTELRGEFGPRPTEEPEGAAHGEWKRWREEAAALEVKEVALEARAGQRNSPYSFSRSSPQPPVALKKAVCFWPPRKHFFLQTEVKK